MKHRALDLGQVLDGTEYLRWRTEGRRQAGFNGCTGVLGQRMAHTRKADNEKYDLKPRI